MATTSALHVADYVVMAVMLLVPLGIGIYFAIKDRGQSSRDVYLLGGGTMSWFPVALSIFVTYQPSKQLLSVGGQRRVVLPNSPTKLNLQLLFNRIEVWLDCYAGQTMLCTTFDGGLLVLSQLRFFYLTTRTEVDVMKMITYCVRTDCGVDGSSQMWPDDAGRACPLLYGLDSAVALMGVPSEIFYSGAMFFVIYIGISLSYVLGYFTIVPLLGPLRLTSINEYLERRYQSRAVRTMAALLGMLMTTCYMAVSHLSPALALQAAVGMPLWMSVAIVGLVGTAYTAMGGIKSVVWTDAFQTVVIFIGILMIIIKGSIAIGGFTTAISVARSQGRLSMEEWSLDPRTKYTWWGMTIGGTFTWLVNVYTQATVQRISAMKNMRDVKRSFLLNIPLYLICAIFR
ncbi:sodium-coupled monocarboxylate transporter 2, partial [Aplysia californica]|uniref:Sodium-coupled monocarboxylate transporter 2 n=1 Tax=Aplysia californica TaxID=6500 RepID=A0ABM1VW69_APLCA